MKILFFFYLIILALFLGCKENYNYKELMENAPRVDIDSLLKDYNVDTSFVIENYIIPNKLNYFSRESDLKRYGLNGKVKSKQIFISTIDSNETRLKISPKIIYEDIFDINGNLLRSNNFDSSGSIQSCTIYNYNISLNCMEANEYNRLNSLIKKEKNYFLEDGQVYLTEIVNTSDNYKIYYFKAFRLDGKDKYEINFTNSLNGITINEYNLQRNIKNKKFFNYDGEMFGETNYIYNQDGNLQTIKFTNLKSNNEAKNLCHYLENGIYYWELMIILLTK